MAKYGKGKRFGTTSGRYGLDPLSIEGRKQFMKDKALKKRDPEKYKRLKKIAKFSADGKITSREAKKLIKRGISMDKVLNRNIKEYRQAQKYMDQAADRGRGRDQLMARRLEMPNFQPLKIKNKARERFLRNMLDLDKKPERQAKPKPEKEEKKVMIDPIKDELPEPEITEEKVKELTPSTPYGVENLVSIRNPRGRIRGGIGQFAAGQKGLAARQFKSKLLNV